MRCAYCTLRGWGSNRWYQQGIPFCLAGWQVSSKIESMESIAVLRDQRRINSGSRNFDYLDMNIWIKTAVEEPEAQHNVA